MCVGVQFRLLLLNMFVCFGTLQGDVLQPHIAIISEVGFVCFVWFVVDLCLLVELRFSVFVVIMLW